MRFRAFISAILLISGSSISAQNYYIQYTHDTLGNRTGRVRGLSTRNMEADGISADTVLQNIVPPKDSMLAFNEKSSADIYDSVKHSALIKTKAEKEAYLREMMAHTASLEPIKIQEETSRSSNDYDVGAIPLQYGVSSTGARTYSIPIATVPDIKYAPSLALVYNSQGGYGYGGYGWDLAGLSAIQLVGKSLYYDGLISAPAMNDTSAVFSLDGVRLVRNEDTATAAVYPLVTAHGHVLVSISKSTSGYVTSFTVKYPDGIAATFGLNINDPSCNYPSYPIISSTNLNGERIEYKYTVDTSEGNYCLYRIDYGFDSQNVAKGRVQIMSAESYSYGYYAGKKVARSPRITKIISSSGGENLFTYTPSYGITEGIRLLTSVSLKNSAGEELPPLSFTYGYSVHPQSFDTLKVKKSIDLPDTFDPGPMMSGYHRGKFVPGSYNDGLIDYIVEPLYRQTGSNKYEYGYPDYYPFVFCSSVYDSDTTTVILSEAGFMGMGAVDVDGDGTDELVKVNCGSTSLTGSVVNVKVYKCDVAADTLVVDHSFSVNLPGVISSYSTKSPLQRTFRWGNFLGNGKTQMLLACYAENVFGTQQTPYYDLIDLETGTILEEDTFSAMTSIGADEEDRLLCVDIDGDSITEMCIAASGGLMVYRFIDGSFTPVKTVSNLTTSVLCNEDVYYTDINADGYIDILSHPDTTSLWTAYINTGLNFAPVNITIGEKNPGDVYFFMDINRDGYPDALRASGTSLWHYLNHDGIHFQPRSNSSAYIPNTLGILPANVVDYSSMSSFIKVDGRSIDEYGFDYYSPEQRHLVQSEDSYGAIIRNTYRYLPHHSLYWTDHPSSTEEGYQYGTLPVYTLSGAKGMLSDDIDSQVFMQDNYAWYDGVVNTRGLGFCGFMKTRKVLYLDTVPVNDVSYYNPMKAGILTSQSRYFSMDSAHPFSTINYTWDDHSTTYGKLSPRLTQSVSTDVTTGVIMTTSYSFDSFDYPTRIITSSRIGTTGIPQISIEDRTYSHSNTTSKYVLGTIVSQRIIRDKNGSPTNMLGERSTFTYDTNFRPLTRYDYRITAHGNPVSPSVQSYLVSKSRWTYDAYGNVLTEESAPYNAAEYTGNTYTYDSSGRHMTSSTNVLGQTTTYSNFDKYGNARTVTDHRNRVRAYSFDSWGKQTKTIYADGTVDSTATAWGGQGVYTAKHIVTDKPSTLVHYDALSREIRSGNQRYNGQWQCTDTEYNQRGYVSRTSLPFPGSNPSYWNTYKYDNYGRRTKITEASGRITQWSYSGVSVTETKDGITVTRTTNAVGDLVSVTDAAGTITYTLRDDGQPSSVTAPGNVTTSFIYDNHGRRTSIIDPSAGTRSTSYQVNSDGSSVTTETNALGSIATSADKYGRVTGVTRTGMGAFNTTYTYDTYGRLTTISSTNSTGEEYTYDTYDRIITHKETVPDGKWLQKAYTYGQGGNIASVDYTSQSGYITTESYIYSAGNLLTIKLPDNTKVISINNENDFGQPTSATSGSVTRTYEYTAYGYPTKRKMTAGGNTIQDLRTTFNQTTGNLSGRFNAFYAQPYESEDFSYDALGRLTSAYSGTMTYDIKGNATKIGGVGTMTYPDSNHPYRIDRLNASSASVTRPYSQSITYTAYDRPASISEWVPHSVFTYNSDYQRVKMETVAQGYTHDKYYVGDRLEIEISPSGTKERLFLGGDAYSAPMVMECTDGSWTKYVIGRDYLGSITHLTTTDGTLVAEYSYDPWGRMRDPETLTPYSALSPGSTIIGRGFCGHEHLTNYGLINMNARLYDPVIGRFLSPDPYVQAPEFSQNFNRYAYALNNPLKYTDESGEIIAETCLILLSAYIGGLFANFFTCNDNPFNPGNWDWKNKNTYWGILSGGLAGAGMTGFTMLHNVQGLFTRGVLNACVNVGVNGFFNTITNANFWKDWQQYAVSGFIFGALTGGALAYENGNNIWWGNSVKYNRSQWSLINTNKPDYVIKYDIPNVGSRLENDCVPTTWAEMEELTGGSRSYEFFVSESSYVDGKGVTISSLDYKKKLLELFPNVSVYDKHLYNNLFDPVYFQDAINNNTYFSVLFEGHADIIRSLNVFERNPLLNTLTFRQSVFNFSRIVHPKQVYFIFKF